MEETKASKYRQGSPKKRITKLCSLLAIILVILIAIPWYALSLLLNQRYEQHQYDSNDFGIESERITLVTDDGLSLAAWRTYAESDTPKGTVIIISGIQNPSVTAFFGYAEMLSSHGWDALLIEKRARSLSEGESIGLAMTEWMDVLAGVDFLDLDERANALPIIAMGTSAGGSAVITAGAEVPRLDGIIAISAYSSFIDVYIDNAAAIGIPRFVAEATRPFMWLQLGFRFGFNELERTPLNAIANLDERPILLMQSTEDLEVPFSHFIRLEATGSEFNAQLSTFVREGDWHFVCYNQYIYTPSQDVEFSRAIFEFLGQFE